MLSDSGNPSFIAAVKEALQRIVIKILGLFQSRKFYGLVAGLVAIWSQMQEGELSPAVAAGSIVTLIIGYIAATAYEDAKRAGG